MYLYGGNVFKSCICEGFLDNGRKKFRKAIKVMYACIYTRIGDNIL